MERKLKASELKRMARQALAGKYGISAGMQIVLALLALLAGIGLFIPLFFIVMGAEMGIGGEGIILGGLAAFFLLALIAAALGFIIMAGMIRFFYHICTGQKFGMGDLLYGFKNRWWRFLGLGALYELIGLIFGVPGTILQSVSALYPWATWLYGAQIMFQVLSAAVSLVISLFFGQTIYILVEDREKKVFSSLAESVRLMKGNKWRYFYLSLSFIGIALLAVCSFGIGFLWVYPYIYCTYIFFYLDIKRTCASGAQETER
ncbi:MAG TPA: DUF975 family protein [Candidatus Lachnoclostridium pullistercoris]|uniref:DUF975 family protein n=1 Tax=Candidatus Lachnoclostridium pullistercoris TaxID=2838632 RepID=A0A9D2PEH1_9FIRM|nr:DUF975 family protein [Candidatus Lachnoclostridium pullistercoris]